MKYCAEGQRLAAACENIVMNKSGLYSEPTPLYWHLVSCDECNRQDEDENEQT